MRELFIDRHRALSESERALLARELAAIEGQCFSDPWSEQAFLDAFDNRVISFFTLYEAGVLAGYAVYAVISPEAELLNLAISPDFRRKGHASALLELADGTLRAGGVEDVYLEVRRSNEAAKALYLARGFTEIGARRAYYRFPTEDAILMALRFQ